MKHLFWIMLLFVGVFFADPILLQGQTMPYKFRILSGEGYTKAQLNKWLKQYIAALPPEQQPLFTRAKELFNTDSMPAFQYSHDIYQPAKLSTDQTYEKWIKFLWHETPIPLRQTNPFTLLELKNARLILIGEDHTYHYPAEQMVEHLLAYNKTAPQEGKITHLFVEFSYQVNFAMEYIRAHFNDGLREKELLEQAVAYSKEKMGKYYMQANLREQVRWLHLGYRLLQENTDVHFYAYDLPSSQIWNRNWVARAFETAVYEQPNTKAVFIGGGIHMLRHNISAGLFKEINAMESLANLADIPKQDIITLFITGGKQWKEGNTLYADQSKGGELYEILLNEFQKRAGDWAFKTDACAFGFDYYLIFDQRVTPVADSL